MARWLDVQGLDAVHVSDIGLHCATDSEIWAFATERSLVILSKSDDFRILANQQRRIPPQLVWVRLGNCRKQALLNAFASILPALVDAIERGEQIIEVR